MKKGCLVLIATLWAVSTLAVQTSAVPSAQSVFAPLIGSWRVEVEGESRLRELAVYRIRPAATDKFPLDAGYGWSDGDTDIVDASSMLKDGKLQIDVTTPASSVIHAEQGDTNTFRGTFTGKSGNSKTVHMSRIVLDLTDIDRPFADEDKDYGIAPAITLTTSYHQKTPLSVPGARTIKTLALRKLMDSTPPPIVIDVLGGTPGKRLTIPSAVWLGAAAGDGRVFAAEKEKFATILSKLTNSDKSKPVVFFCLNVECWLSYNASLRAVEEGYKDVYWYRGGWKSWKTATLPFIRAERVAW